MLRRVCQHTGQLRAAWNAFEARRRCIEPADQGFVVVAAIDHDDPPEQAVERRRRAEQLHIMQAALGQQLLDLVLGHGLAAQAESQVQAGQGQCGDGQPLRSLTQATEQADDHRHQQRQGIERVDDKHRGPGHRWWREWPEQLGAVTGEGIQQRMGDQRQPDGEEQSSCGVARIGAQPAGDQGDQHGQAAENKQRVAEAAVVGHVGDGIAVVDDHVQVGQGAEHGAIEQCPTALPAAEQGALNGGTEYRLGDRVHGLLMKKVRPLSYCPALSLAARKFQLKISGHCRSSAVHFDYGQEPPKGSGL